MTEQICEQTTQVIESESSEDLSSSQSQIQNDPSPEQKSKRSTNVQPEVVQQAHEVKQNTIPPSQFQICRKKQEPANNPYSSLAEGNSHSLRQISSFAAPEAAPESWLTLAKDSQTASFAHMVSIVNDVLLVVQGLGVSKLLSDLLEIPKVQALAVYSRIEKHRTPLERAENRLLMHARAFAPSAG
jgi:hypothetical protein